MDVFVPLLVTAVLGDVVKVIPADNDGVGHLPGRDDEPLEDATADGNVSGERALLVYVTSLNGLLGSLEAEADRASVAHGLPLGPSLAPPGNEHGILLLVRVL